MHGYQLVLTLLSAVSSTAAASDFYKFTNVADRFANGVDLRSVSDVNSNARVVGWDHGIFNEGGQWQLGTVFNPGGASTPMSWHYGINDSNDIAGAATTTFANLSPYQVARINGQVTVLGSTLGAAYDVNNSRLVVGTGGGHGSLWTWDSAANSFHTITPGPDAAALGHPRINASGQIFASRTLYDPVGGTTTLPTSLMYPAGLNDSGDVVGNNAAAIGAGSQATLRMASGQLISFSSMVNGRATFASGMSNDGTVAVLVQRDGLPPTSFLSMIWDAQHGLRDLNALILPDPSLPGVGESFSVSENGDILLRAVVGTFRTNVFGVLPPVPAPGGTALVAVSLGLAARRRRKS